MPSCPDERHPVQLLRVADHRRLEVRYEHQVVQPLARMVDGLEAVDQRSSFHGEAAAGGIDARVGPG